MFSRQQADRNNNGREECFSFLFTVFWYCRSLFSFLFFSFIHSSLFSTDGVFLVGVFLSAFFFALPSPLFSELRLIEIDYSLFSLIFVFLLFIFMICFHVHYFPFIFFSLSFLQQLFFIYVFLFFSYFQRRVHEMTKSQTTNYYFRMLKAYAYMVWQVSFARLGGRRDPEADPVPLHCHPDEHA